MYISQSKIIHMIVVIGMLMNVKASTLVTFENECSCEQLLYEKECNELGYCKFLDQKCSTLPCSELGQKNCGYNSNCSLVNQKCVNFQSCSSHNSKTEEDCDNLYHNCQFEESNSTCNEYQKINVGSCEKDLLSFCLIADEGLCILKDGKCQEMTKCEDAKSSDFQCLLSFPACNPSNVETKQCESHLKCSESEWLECRIAKEKINGDRYQLCMKGTNGCVDFNPSNLSQETCLNVSSSFYHWDGNKCVSCSSNSFLISMIGFVILFLNI